MLVNWVPTGSYPTNPLAASFLIEEKGEQRFAEVMFRGDLNLQVEEKITILMLEDGSVAGFSKQYHDHLISTEFLLVNRTHPMHPYTNRILICKTQHLTKPALTR